MVVAQIPNDRTRPPRQTPFAPGSNHGEDVSPAVDQGANQVAADQAGRSSDQDRRVTEWAHHQARFRGGRIASSRVSPVRGLVGTRVIAAVEIGAVGAPMAVGA